MKRPMFIFVLGLTATLGAVVTAASVTAASVTAASATPVAVTTYHNDNYRTGWNSSETTLSAASFPSKFGVLRTVTFDANIETQPLGLSVMIKEMQTTQKMTRPMMTTSNIPFP
jgi:hypothetical protein